MKNNGLILYIHYGEYLFIISVISYFLGPLLNPNETWIKSLSCKKIKERFINISCKEVLESVINANGFLAFFYIILWKDILQPQFSQVKGIIYPDPTTIISVIIAYFSSWMITKEKKEIPYIRIEKK